MWLKTQDKEDIGHDLLREFSNCTKKVNIIYHNLTENKLVLCDYLFKWRENNVEVDLQELIKNITNITKTTICVKLRSFQFRIITHSLITNVRLKYFGITCDDACTFCSEKKRQFIICSMNANKVNQLD